MKSVNKTIFSLLTAAAILLSSLIPCFDGKVKAQIVGDMEMSGDSFFDCDSISDNTAGQPYWLSYPGTRMTLNPDGGTMQTNLPLSMGGFVGTDPKRLTNICEVKLAPTGETAYNASSVSTTWYPHKISFNAVYNNPSGSVLSGYDFFADNLDTVIRVIEVNGGSSKELILEGTVNGTLAQWVSDDKVLLISDDSYHYALKIVQIDAVNNYYELSQVPSIGSSRWSIRIPCDTQSMKFAIAFGFAAKNAETSTDAINRAKGSLSQSVEQTLTESKDYYNTLLRKVPKPTIWGINYVPDNNVTPLYHKIKYYEAWTFVLANYMRDIPEDSYPYPQVLCGKPSLWNGGHPSSPGTCAWESFFGYQFLAYLLPDEAWSAYEGIMSHVQQDGQLPGECLPSRKAQTAWYLYCMTNDQPKLSSVYPAIKRYLEWREQNPRWIWSNMDIQDEKDMEFVVSWLRDVDYAVKICETLGLTSDKNMWISKQTTMINNMRSWFITSTEIYQYWFAQKQTHYYWYRNEDLPHMIVTALDIRNMPSDLANRFKSYYLSYHNASQPLCGFNRQKHPDSDFVFYGLLENGMYQQFKEYVNANLRECIKISPFTERIGLSRDSTVIEQGSVTPSLLSACTVITATFLTNNVRVDSGYPEALMLPNTPQPVNLALNKTVSSSSVETGTSFYASKAVDGSMSTRWSSNYTSPQWLSVDLGETYSIKRVVLKWEAAYAKSYKIQVSGNGTNWTDVYSTTSCDGGIDEISFDAVNTRYVRVYGTEKATTWGYSIYEFEVYGD